MKIFQYLTKDLTNDASMQHMKSAFFLTSSLKGIWGLN